MSSSRCRAEELPMTSPFPGMDPYIEACELWEDFHDKLIVAVEGALAANLPRGYISRIGKRSYIALVEAEERTVRSFIPDVKITGPAARREAATQEAEPGTVAT